MEATDQAFDGNPTHPTTVAKQQQHRQIAENGKQGIREADEMIARHESKRKTAAAAEPQAAAVANQQGGAPGVAAPGIAAPNRVPETFANAAPYSEQPLQAEVQGGRLHDTGHVGQANAHYTAPGATAPNPATENSVNAAPYSQQPVGAEGQGSRLQGAGRVGQSNAHYTTPGFQEPAPTYR